MSLRELSRPALVTALPHESARTAAQRMKQSKVGALVVTDELTRPIGIVTDRDLVLSVVADERDPDELTVEQCMTPDPSTLPADASLVDAARLVRRTRVRRIPLIDEDGVAVGLVSVDDLLHELAAGLRFAAEAPGRGYLEEGRRRGTQSVFGKE
jgi:CBS domain-containing protein